MVFTCPQYIYNVTHTHREQQKRAKSYHTAVHIWIYIYQIAYKLIDLFIDSINIEFLVCLQYSRCQEYGCEQETQISTILPFILVGE